MKSFFTGSKLIYLLPLFILSFSYTYSQTVSGITGTFLSGAGNAADANGSYSPNGTINGKNSWVHIGSSSNFYIYWGNSGGTDYWVLDNNTDLTDDALFYIASTASIPPTSGYSPGLIDNTSLPTLSGFDNVTISGNAGVAGATLSWTDGTAKTTTADGSGNYSITVSNNFTGTVTPSLTGYTFSPTSKSYTNITSNQTNQNYTATAITYTISGNAGIAGATLSWTDGSAKTTTADGSGNYSFTVSYNFTGTVTPSLTGYTFSPTNKSYTSVLANQTSQNYTATAITFTISGNTVVPGATLSWTDGTSKTATSDGSGNYSITVSYNFSGTVTPSKSGYVFSPTNKTYTNLLANQNSQNYAGFVTISGNAGTAGATITWTQSGNPTPTITTADGSGNYSVLAPYNSQGYVTPTATGFNFTPDHIEYPVLLTTPQTNQNYTATPITYTISGNAGVGGAILEWFDPSLKTTTADGSGNYSITVSYNFSGAVTPVLGGYDFSPTSKTYTNVLSNQTNQNYTATAITYTISGNAGIAGATLSWTDGTAKTATADGSGNYSFTVSYNFTGTVTPSLAGYTFSPTSKSYTNVVANQTSQNYTATATTYTISGNAGVAGTTLSWTDGTAKTTTADGSGNYSFTVSYNFTGTVTPSLTGYTFTPTSKSYTNVLANQTSQNYTATAITYTISGNAGVAGATLSWTDGTAKTATADGSGNYTITVSNNFTGTVTPSLTGYTFSPTSKSYTTITSNQTSQNYTATAITYTIVGNATVPGATISWTDGTAKTATADGAGNYSITVSYNFSGTVTPSETGFTFSPASRTYTNVLSNQIGQQYSALVTISGNAGVAGATLTWNDGSTKTATADGSGNYSLLVSYNFSGRITPSAPGYTFTPQFINYSGVTTPQTNQNYTALVTISGNAGIAGATLSWTDGTAKTTTADGSGNYSFTVSYNFSGTVTPSLSGSTFSPASRTYTNILTNQTNQNYAGLLTISGNAGVAGATLSWTDGTAKTTTADGSGNYSFTVSYNFTGSVTPSLTGYLFTPVNKTYTNLTAGQTNQNYTALVTISGNAGIAGATLSWTDVTAKTTTADGSGNYSFTVSYNFTGSVTPSLTGYLFSPVNKTYTNLTTNQTNQNFTALVTISGNAGVPGATLSWTDGTAKTTTADGSGNYSFTVSYNFSGTVTPSLTGYLFTPTNKTYTNVTANQPNQNYTALITISGNAGIAGATLSWTDGTAKTTTADGSGNYSFAVSYNWSGTVTPSLTGYLFTPASKTYTNVTANQINQNYTALVTISGNVGIAGATLSWTDGTAKTTTADGSGNYSFTVSYNFSGSVTPSLTGYLFTPVNKTYTNLTSNQTNQNYTALVTISGNAGAPGVTLSWTDGTAKTATADGSGNYSFTVAYNWSGTVTPSLGGFVFSPDHRTYTNVTSNQINQIYIATALTFSIFGNTTIDGVTLSWIDGTSKTTISDTSGNYKFTVSYNWSGTVTPSRNGFSFTPVNKTYPGTTADMINQNYSASISGAPLAKEAIQIGNNSFTANWGILPGIQGYRIDVAIDPNFANILPNYNNLEVDTNSSVSVTGLISGTDYYYRIRAYHRGLVSSNSNTIVAATALNPPTNLTAVYDTVGIQLKWVYDFNNTSVNGFVIFRDGGPNSGNPKLSKIAALSPIDTVNGTTTAYVDRNVVEGYAYNYSVSAYNLNGVISAVGSTVSTPVIIPLKTPINLAGVAQPGGKIVLFWKNQSTTEDGSIIERSVGDSISFSQLAKTFSTDTTYTDSTTQNGLRYYYRVAAYRDTIESAYSNMISIVNTLTGIRDLLMGIPKEYQLYQNYPNPFNPTTQIRFALPKESHVNITIYNILGAEVEKLYEGDLTAGYHEIQFNASRLSSGIYLYRIIAGTYSKVLKMVMIK